MPRELKPLWTMDTPDDCSKSFRIYGPGIDLDVGFDDVEHDDVAHKAERVLAVLNQHWNDPPIVE